MPGRSSCLRPANLPLLLIALAPLVLGTVVGRAVGASGGTDGDGNWLQGLIRPAATPPAYMFPIVWPILYALLGTSVFLAACGKPPAQAALVCTALFVHMLFNLSFPFAQMGLRDLDLARTAAWATYLTALLLAVTFVSVRDPSQPLWRYLLPVGLLVPYLIWLAFASYLSDELLSLNPPKTI